jgi:hypothetical protein
MPDGKKSRIKPDTLRQFQKIPGVGKKIAEDFWRLGLRTLDDLEHKEPELLYQQFCILEGKPVDRCMLYVFRCAVYYASNTEHQPELLKWWNWKDQSRFVGKS